MINLCTKAALRVSLLFLITLTFLDAKYFFVDNVIQVKEFTDKIEILGEELHQKTGWNLYLLAEDDIGEQKLIDYQMSQSKKLQTPFIMFSLAIKQQKMGVYGSEDYRKQFDYDAVIRNVERILGSKVKGDPRQKYIVALNTGYGDIADQVADTYKVDLIHSDGNSNRIVLGIIRIIFYTIIIASLGVYFYKRYLKKRVNK